MLVRMHLERSVTFDLNATLNRPAAAEQRDGDVRLLVPRDSVAWDTAILAEHGGHIIELIHGGERWVGITEAPRFTPDGADISAWSVTKWISIRNVATHRMFYGVTAGAVIRAGYRDALGGSHLPLMLGPVLDDSPPVGTYSFAGQSFGQVLTDMVAWTGHEWWIDSLLRFRWGRQGRYHTFNLVDDGSSLNQVQSGALADTFMEITEVADDGISFTVSDYRVPAFWPAQRRERI